MPGELQHDRKVERDVLGTSERPDIGEVWATVFVRPELEHTDVFVRLCDVDEQGVSRNVVEGIRRLSPLSVPAPDVTVGEDGVLAVHVELFPTAYRVRAGHRLRLVVTGGAFPRYAVNLGIPGSQQDALEGRPNRIEVLHDAEHPSRLTVQVLPDADQRTTPASSASR